MTHGRNYFIIEKIITSHNAKCDSLSSQSKKDNVIEVDKLIVFFSSWCIVQFCQHWFSGQTVSVYLRDCQMSLQWNSWQ